MWKSSASTPRRRSLRVSEIYSPRTSPTVNNTVVRETKVSHTPSLTSKDDIFTSSCNTSSKKLRNTRKLDNYTTKTSDVHARFRSRSERRNAESLAAAKCPQSLLPDPSGAACVWGTSKNNGRNRELTLHNKPDNQSFIDSVPLSETEETLSSPSSQIKIVAVDSKSNTTNTTQPSPSINVLPTPRSPTPTDNQIPQSTPTRSRTRSRRTRSPTPQGTKKRKKNGSNGTPNMTKDSSAAETPNLTINSSFKYDSHVAISHSSGTSSECNSQDSFSQNHVSIKPSLTHSPQKKKNSKIQESIIQISHEAETTNIRLSATVEELCLQVSNLESLIRSLNKKINDLSKQNSNAPTHPKTCEKCTQISSDVHPNHTKTHNSTPPFQPKVPPLNSKINSQPATKFPSPSNSRQNSQIQKQEKGKNTNVQKKSPNKNANSQFQTKQTTPSPSKEKTQQSKIYLPSNTKKKSIWYNAYGTVLNSSETINSPPKYEKHPEHPESDSNSADLPKVWIVHDSIFRNINEIQLGNSYDCSVTKIQANRIEQISSSIETTLSDLDFENKPESIIIQTGINNVRTNDPEQTSKQLVNELTKIKRKIPSAKIIVHQLAPTRIWSLNTKAKLHNAMIDYLTESDRDITSMKSTLLANNTNMKDDIHPSQKGSSILACTLGRFIRNSLWSIQPSFNKYHNHSYYSYV